MFELQQLIIILDFVIGIAFGFVHRGREDYTGLLRNSAICGLVVGILFVLLSGIFFSGNAGLLAGFLGVFGIFIVIILYVIVFIIGAFVGDLLESRLKK